MQGLCWSTNISPRLYRQRLKPIQAKIQACTGKGSRLYRQRSTPVQAKVHACTGKGSRLYRQRLTPVQAKAHACTGKGSRLYRQRLAPVQAKARACTDRMSHLQELVSWMYIATPAEAAIFIFLLFGDGQCHKSDDYIGRQGFYCYCCETFSPREGHGEHLCCAAGDFPPIDTIDAELTP